MGKRIDFPGRLLNNSFPKIRVIFVSTFFTEPFFLREVLGKIFASTTSWLSRISTNKQHVEQWC